MRHKLLLILFLIFIPIAAHSQDIADYLILQDIGPYKISVPHKSFAPGAGIVGGPKLGTGPGILGGSGHFSLDHIDTSAKVMYLGGNDLPSPDVTVTLHPGAESDKWLLHEVEDAYRGGDYDEDMTPSRFKTIDGNNIFYTKLGGGTYSWLHNNIVVNIEYVDLYHKRAEPLEVVKAYLAKFPSTTPSLTIDRAHNEKWIKDEMERRLWLSDKWFAQLDAGKAEKKDALFWIAKNLETFLKYREKYYGVASGEDNNVIFFARRGGDVDAMRNMLAGYKSWWASNKTGSINLP